MEITSNTSPLLSELSKSSPVQHNVLSDTLAAEFASHMKAAAGKSDHGTHPAHGAGGEGSKPSGSAPAPSTTEPHNASSPHSGPAPSPTTSSGSSGKPSSAPASSTTEPHNASSPHSDPASSPTTSSDSSGKPSEEEGSAKSENALEKIFKEIIEPLLAALTGNGKQSSDGDSSGKSTAAGGDMDKQFASAVANFSSADSIDFDQYKTHLTNGDGNAAIKDLLEAYKKGTLSQSDMAALASDTQQIANSNGGGRIDKQDRTAMADALGGADVIAKGDTRGGEWWKQHGADVLNGILQAGTAAATFIK